jgi:hypothetical protein
MSKGTAHKAKFYRTIMSFNQEENHGMIKIHDGTPIGNRSLCQSCTNCTHIKGYAPSQEIIICQAVFENPMRMTFPVYECNSYYKQTDTKLKDMEKDAWILNIKRGRVMGFITGDQFKEDNPDKEILP